MCPQSEARITTRSERGVVVVSVFGPITSGSPNKEELLSEFSKLLDIGLRRFALDLESVSKMDSDGISELVSAYNLVTDRNGDLTFRGAVTIPLHDHLTIGMDSERTIESEISELLDIGFTSFVLDFEKVSKMHTDGIGDIVALYARVTNRGGKLALVNLPRKIREILEIMQVASLFDR